MTGSVYLPWAATALSSAQLQVTVTPLEGGQAFTAADQATMVATSGPLAGTPVAFSVVGDALVGTFAPPAGFAFDPGDQLATGFNLQLAAGGPDGAVQLDLELVDLTAGSTVVATDTEVTEVHAAAPLALWSGAPKVAALGSYATATARVFNPDLAPPLPAVTAPELRVTIDAPTALAAADVQAWSDAVPMPLALDGSGDLVGTWPLTDPLPVPFDEDVAWYLLVGEAAPLGVYELRLELADSTGVLSTDAAEVLVLEGATNGPPQAPGAPIDVVATPGDGEGHGVVAGAGRRRRQPDPQLHGDRRPGRHHLRDQHDQLHDHRADQRRRLHLHRGGDERHRHGAAVGTVGAGGTAPPGLRARGHRGAVPRRGSVPPVLQRHRLAGHQRHHRGLRGRHLRPDRPGVPPGDGRLPLPDGRLAGRGRPGLHRRTALRRGRGQPVLRGDRLAGRRGHRRGLRRWHLPAGHHRVPPGHGRLPLPVRR